MTVTDGRQVPARDEGRARRGPGADRDRPRESTRRRTGSSPSTSSRPSSPRGTRPATTSRTTSGIETHVPRDVARALDEHVPGAGVRGRARTDGDGTVTVQGDAVELRPVRRDHGQGRTAHTAEGGSGPSTPAPRFTRPLRSGSGLTGCDDALSPMPSRGLTCARSSRRSRPRALTRLAGLRPRRARRSLLRPGGIAYAFARQGSPLRPSRRARHDHGRERHPLALRALIGTAAIQTFSYGDSTQEFRMDERRPEGRPGPT